MLGISVNSESTNKRFAEKIGVTFPLLSDAKHSASEAYGVFHHLFRVAKRATFVVDRDGTIQHIEEGSASVDPSPTQQACSMLEPHRI